MEPIPLVDLRPQVAQISEEVAIGFARVLDRTDFVLGEEVAEFEAEFAAFQGVPHCVGVANGTDAIELALRAVRLVPGDEVILPANTFVASAAAVARAGGTIVLVDVDTVGLLIAPEAVAGRIGPRTRAVLAVHLFGQMAVMEELQALATGAGVAVVEDAAQAQGARRHGLGAGGVGVIAATSFYPGKNLGAFGDAGAVLTTSVEMAARVRRLRDHGLGTGGLHEELGFNSRLDTLQAVVLKAKLARLADWNADRQKAALRYDELLEGVDAVERPVTLEGNVHVWHLYVVRVPDRDRVVRRLHQAGIAAGVHYRNPVHLQGAFRHLGHTEGDFPVAEAACRSVLSLPIFPGITPDQQERVVDELRASLP